MPTHADIGLDSSGDLPVHFGLITGIDLIAQRISVALRLHRGEWLQDVRVGLPWLEWVQIKPPPLSAISAALRSTVLGVPGVLEVTRYTATHDVETESVAIEMDVRTDEGEMTVRVSDPSGRSGNQFPQWFILAGSRTILPA